LSRGISVLTKIKLDRIRSIFTSLRDFVNGDYVIYFTCICIYGLHRHNHS